MCNDSKVGDPGFTNDRGHLVTEIWKHLQCLRKNIRDALIKSAKIQRLKRVRWQGMTKQCGRPHIMRNDTASVPLSASRRALHVRKYRIS